MPALTLEGGFGHLESCIHELLTGATEEAVLESDGEVGAGARVPDLAAHPLRGGQHHADHHEGAHTGTKSRGKHGGFLPGRHLCIDFFPPPAPVQRIWFPLIPFTMRVIPPRRCPSAKRSWQTLNKQQWQ